MKVLTLQADGDDADFVIDALATAAQAESEMDTVIIPTSEVQAESDRMNETLSFVREAATVAAVREGPLAKAFRNIVVNAVISRTGASAGLVRQAVAQVEQQSGHPFLDFLTNGGLEGLIKLVIEVLGLFGFGIASSRSDASPAA